MKKARHTRPEELVRDGVIFDRRGGNREIDNITREHEVIVQSDVRGSCFQLVDEVARRFAPDTYLERLYRPFDDFHGYTDPSLTCLREHLIDQEHTMPHSLWNELCRRFEQDLTHSPTILWETGRMIEDLDMWGGADKLKRAVGQLFDIRMGVAGIPQGNFAFNTNKFWRVIRFWRAGGFDFAELAVQIRNQELGLDHNIDCWSFHFWTAIASAVPRIWGRPHADIQFQKIQFDMLPYLEHFKMRAEFHQLDCLRLGFELVGEQLMIDGEVAGQVIGTNSRNRPIVRITRTVPYAGPLNLVNAGEEYGHEEFRMIYRWTPIYFTDRLRLIWKKIQNKLSGETGSDQDFHTADAHVLYEVSRRELELLEQRINQERLVALDEMRRLKKAVGEDRLARAISIATDYEVYDGYTTGHVDRVKVRARLLAQLFGITDRQALVVLGHSAQLHDLGKRRVPKDILGKPGKHTREEWLIMQRHTIYGEEMAVEAEFAPEIRDVIRHHHELLDGTGYPDGLKSDQIAVAVRIVQISDVFDALTAKRPYPKEDGRYLWSADESLQFLQDRFVKAGKMDRDIFEHAAACFPETVEPV